MIYFGLPESIRCAEVPNLHGISVSEDGRVFHTQTEVVFEQRYSGEYKCVNLFGLSFHVHRLMALAFLEKPKNIPDPDVNHKDGNKTNNHIDNLEWCTRQENCLHAYKTGLRTDNLVIQVKDLRTEEIVEYYSLCECARKFGVNPALINHYLKNTEKIRKLFFVFIIKGQPWPPLTKEDIGKSIEGRPKVVIGLNLSTNVKTMFATVKEAAEHLGIKSETLYAHIKRYETKPYHGYAFEFTTDLEIIAAVEKERPSLAYTPVKRKPVPILVTNTLTGDKNHWDSTELFAASVGAKKNTIQKRVYVTGGNWKHYHIEYLN